MKYFRGLWKPTALVITVLLVVSFATAAGAQEEKGRPKKTEAAQGPEKDSGQEQADRLEKAKKKADRALDSETRKSSQKEGAAEGKAKPETKDKASGGREAKEKSKKVSDEAKGQGKEKAKGDGKAKKVKGQKQINHEKRKHLKRMAKIERLLQIAGEKNNTQMLSRLAELKEKELRRHAKVMVRLEGTKPEGAGDLEGVDSPKAPTKPERGKPAPEKKAGESDDR